MARKVRLRVPVEIRVSDRDIRALHIIDGASSRPGGQVSYANSDLARELGVSDATAHRALVSCVERGYLETKTNVMANGAQLANSYRITPFGLDILAAARTAGVV